MTVGELIETLEEIPEDKIVCIGTPNGWSNTGKVVEELSIVYIEMDCSRPFSED